LLGATLVYGVRCTKQQKKYYSGKQKCHTIKSQILINQQTKEIICIAVRKRKIHDFRVWKESQIKTELLADKGYQGIKKIHPHSRTPIKKTKKKPLDKEQKQFNKQLAKERIVVEHVHRRLEIFRILSSRYRNRRRRFGLRINLIAGIYNYELYLSSQQSNGLPSATAIA
jgi:transposase